MADILIRGMEMPKSCDECRLFNECWYMALGVDDWRKSYNKPPEGERLPDCPLVPLPEGHGKIIDADAIWRNMTDDQGWVFQWGLASDIELFEILEAAEAIVPAEGGTDECSEN